MYYLMHKESGHPVKLVVNSVVPVLSRYEYYFDYELTDTDGMTIFPDKESCISEWSHNNWYELEVCNG
ncbi:hypothetical protein vBVpaMR16F_178 [Vibrio phage vB_VpaM_R16F]|nr:hypothetical protein vBVpaMR16F_178 [Vibrio phage vB_VpaM_R16F]